MLRKVDDEVTRTSRVEEVKKQATVKLKELRVLNNMRKEKSDEKTIWHWFFGSNAYYGPCFHGGHRICDGG